MSDRGFVVVGPVPGLGPEWELAYVDMETGWMSRQVTPREMRILRQNPDALQRPEPEPGKLVRLK